MPAEENQLAALERDLEARYRAKLEQEVARLRAESREAVEEFKRTFPAPTDEQIERLLYPELSEFAVELGGRKFVLRELPALVERKFLRLVEQKLPAIVAEILRFDEHLDDDATSAFASVLARAASAMELVADACLLVLDPGSEAGLTRAFLEQHASTARMVRILHAQLMLNGARDFLSQLFPALRPQEAAGRAGKTSLNPAPPATRGSPEPSPGSSSSASRPATSLEDSPSANSH